MVRIVQQAISQIDIEPRDYQQRLVEKSLRMYTRSFEDRFGRLPASNALQRWLRRNRIPTVQVDASGQWPDPLDTVGEMVRSDPSAFCRALLEHLPPSTESSLPSPTEQSNPEQKQMAEPFWEHAIYATLNQALPQNSLLFLGNSTVIRDADNWLHRTPQRVIASLHYRHCCSTQWCAILTQHEPFLTIFWTNSRNFYRNLHRSKNLEKSIRS